MMEQVAKVIGQDSPDWVSVEVEMKSACNHCDNHESCGTGAVAKAFSTKMQRFAVPADRPYQQGDLLKLGLPESVVLKTAALVYLLPLSGLLLGGITGQWLGQLSAQNANATAMAGGLLGGLLAWWIGKRNAAAMESEAQPVILSYLGRELSPEDASHQ